MIKNAVTLGNATLYCGDCFTILPNLAQHSIAAMITDPPYLFGLASHQTLRSTATTRREPINVRFSDALNYAVFYTQLLTCVDKVLLPDGATWLFTNWRGLPVLMKGVIDAKHGIESLLVWDKVHFGAGGQVGLRPRYELCALIPRGKFSLPNRSLPDIWTHKRCTTQNRYHPAQKPDALMDALVQETPGDSVLDPFMGSGSTGVATVKQGKHFVGCEVNPDYFNVACQRIADAQGLPFTP